MKKSLLKVFFLMVGTLILPGLTQAGRLLVLPLAIDTSRIHDHQAVQDFFFEALEKYNGGNTIRTKGDSLCAEKECAVAKAKSEKAEQVVFGSVRFLGRKCFFTSTIMGPNGEDPYSQTINLLGVADFENGTKRMAEAMILRTTIEKVANIENITDKEEVVQPTRRRSFYSMGGSIGYMYPLGGSYHRWQQQSDIYGLCYNDDSSAQCVDQDQSYRQMVVLGWNNWFEFRPELAMEMNFIYALPMAVGVDVDIDYLFGKSDFTPFLGGGLGLHYVVADEGSHEDANKMNSGPTLNFQGGLICFRTYDINLVIKGGYHIVLNSDKDNGFGLELGVRTKF
jgi:hypothetical protein